MHNYLYQKLSIDACYTRTQLEDGKKLREVFLSKALYGANITVPFKEEAYRQCDEVRGIAKEIKAVNTIVKENDKLIGYNTDAPGILHSIGKMTQKRAKTLILGAGGTAKATALILAQNGYDVTITNRSKEKLGYFKEYGLKCATHEDLQERDFEIIINTTSAGLITDDLPLPKKKLLPILQHSSYAIDAIYNKQTPFLNLAKECNNEIKDGRDMLVFQGIIAFNLFLFRSYEVSTLESLAQEAITL
jgi:shikimate dehydrogenase